MRRGKNMMTVVALWLTMTVLLTGCHRKTVYNSYLSTNEKGWGTNDTLFFSVDTMKQSGTYEGFVGLRTTSDYPYRALTLIVEQQIFAAATSADSVKRAKTFFSDTLYATLTDEDGHNLGKGIGTYQYLFPLRRYELQRGDSLAVCIHHYMRANIITGITDVGVKVKSEE